MDNKQIEEAVAWLTPFDTDVNLTSDHIRSINILLSLAQLFLSVKGAPKKKDFEYFLTEKHAEQYIGTKDCMIDDFNKWVEDLGVDELIEYANKFNNLCHDEFTAWLAGRMEENKTKAEAILQAIRTTPVGNDIIIHNSDHSLWCVLTVKCKEHKEDETDDGGFIYPKELEK